MTAKPVRDIRVAKVGSTNKFQVWARLSAQHIKVAPKTVRYSSTKEYNVQDYFVWVIIASHDRLRDAVEMVHGVHIEPVPGEWLS